MVTRIPKQTRKVDQFVGGVEGDYKKKGQRLCEVVQSLECRSRNRRIIL